MFRLSLIEHTLPVPPHLLNRPLVDALREEIERLFLDKVIKDLGLCVSVYDIQSIEGGFIFPGDGSSTYTVVFRLLMFRPFKGEILSGTVETSDEKGVRVSLGFFNDIYVPRHLLQQPCKRGDDGLWIWEHECGELPLDLDEEIIFQVNNVKYPTIPVTQDEKAKPFAPMEIIGDIHGDGLGLVAWWR